jgi:alpha-galactosidase
LESTEHGPSLDNGIVRAEVHLNQGTYSLFDCQSGASLLSEAAVMVTLRDGPTFTSRGEGLEMTGRVQANDTHGRGISLLLARETYEDEPELHLVLTLYDGQPFLIVECKIQTTGPAQQRILNMRPMDGARISCGPVADLRFYKHGWQSWSPTVVLDCSGEDLPMSPPVVGPGTQPQPRAGRFVSELVTALANRHSGEGIVAGFVSTADQFSHVYFDREEKIVTAVSHADGVSVPARGLSSERLYVAGGEATKQLCGYGDALARQMDANPSTSVPSGWCSWYYYWQEISEAEAIANLDFLVANRGSLPFDYFQIDDGYQSEIGDWLSINEKFPHGMKWLAERIHERGLRAGLWVAPFIAGARSRLFQERPDWFVKFSTGHPAIATMNWGQLCFALDTTNPQVLKWLNDVFHTICNNWNFDYVKIDFIFGAALEGDRYDPNVTRAQAYRRGLECIREAVGDRFILACGNPQAPSVGLVDGARVGPDVAPYWHPVQRLAPRDPMSDPSAVNSIRNSILRFWMHNRLWANDPDCVLVRDTDTALGEEEVRTLATVIGMTGGMVLDSDKLSGLVPERIRILSSMLPVYGKSAVPIDLFDTADIPQRLLLDCGTHVLLAVFNWDQAGALVRANLPPGVWHAAEFWSAEYLGALQEQITLEIPAHGCRVVRLTPDLGHPRVIGSTLHMTQGAMEISAEEWDGKQLRVALRPVANRDGILLIWRPRGIQKVHVSDLTEPRTVVV